MRRWLLWALVALLAALWGVQLKIESRLRERITARDGHIRALTDSAVALRRRLALAVPLVDSLVDTLWLRARAQVESLPVDRPVPYPVYVRTVVAADTTINACTRTLHDCATLAATDSMLIDSLRAQVRDVKRLAQPRVQIWGYGENDLRGHWYGGVAVSALRVPFLGIQGYARAETRLDSLALNARVGGRIPF